MSNNKVISKETLKSVLQQVEHEFGKGSVVRLGDKPKVDVEAISSGSILLDDCLGIGG